MSSDFLPQLLGASRPFSVSQLKTWSRCRKKFYYDYVKALRWPADQSNFRLGQQVHKLMEFQSRGLDCQPLLSGTQPDVRAAWGLLSRHPITQLPILGSEWGFLLPIPLGEQRYAWLEGRIDRIVLGADGRILVIDWKTGTAVPRAPEADWQTQVYLFAVVAAAHELGLTDQADHLEGLKPDNAAFVYVEVKQQVREIEIAYTAAMHEATRQRLQETIAEILREEEYALPNACPDRFCQYRPICGIED